MKPPFNATGRRVVVRIPDSLGLSKSGVITGDKERPDRGIIVSKGHLVDDPAIELGKLAIFGKFSGQEYEEPSEDGDSKNKYILLDVGELYITKDVEK